MFFYLLIREKGYKFAIPFFCDYYTVMVRMFTAKSGFKILLKLFLIIYLVVLKNGFSFAPAFRVKEIRSREESEEEGLIVH